MFYFLVAGINFLIYYVLFSPKVLGQQLGSSKTKIFFVIAFALILGQFAAFANFKEKNFYEIYNKPRLFFENQALKQNPESQTARIPSKARPNSISEYGEYILNHEGLRVFYDKYGSNFLEILPNSKNGGQSSITQLKK